jgi:hypothetical protein
MTEMYIPSAIAEAKHTVTSASARIRDRVFFMVILLSLLLSAWSA